MEPTIHFQLDLDAPIEQVWQAWTTADGLRSFFSPTVNMELRPGGPFEILFSEAPPEGQRGSEDMIVMAFKEPEFFAFTWNAPPTLPGVRPHMTHVTLRLTPLDGGGTRIEFKEDGFATGGEWDERVDYFKSAWGQVVLPRLVMRFERGPIDWEDEIDLTPYRAMIQSIN